jgi:hypothetical protein
MKLCHVDESLLDGGNARRLIVKPMLFKAKEVLLCGLHKAINVAFKSFCGPRLPSYFRKMMLNYLVGAQKEVAKGDGGSREGELWVTKRRGCGFCLVCDDRSPHHQDLVSACASKVALGQIGAHCACAGQKEWCQDRNKEGAQHLRVIGPSPRLLEPLLQREQDGHLIQQRLSIRPLCYPSF